MSDVAPRPGTFPGGASEEERPDGDRRDPAQGDGGGLTLTAKYKKAEHTAEVVAGEDGRLVYRLADGREFKSPSAAGSAVMGGVACNGWRFWSLATDEADAPTKPAAKKAGSKRAPKQTATTEAQAEPTPETPADGDEA